MTRSKRDARGYLVVEVSATAVAEQPSLKWNALCALLSSVAVEELHPSQRSAWRVFEYEGEVQNGGHELYFDVRDGNCLEEAVEALVEVGARAQAEILGSAIQRFRSRVGGGYDDLDAAFGATEPSLVDVLEAWLEAHPDTFVVVA